MSYGDRNGVSVRFAASIGMTLACATALHAAGGVVRGAPGALEIERIETASVAYRDPMSPRSSPVATRADDSQYAAAHRTLAVLSSDDDMSDADPSVDIEARARKAFGDAGAMRLCVLAGYGYDFETSHEVGGGVALSYFMVDWLSVDLELLGWGFAQEGPNSAGGNVNLLFRWHFSREGRTTLYVDGGVGILGTSSDVPFDGSSFNFTPQVGAGVSFDLGDDTHLLVGLRWHHISNGRLASNNPGRDSVLIYAGLSFPLR